MRKWVRSVQIIFNTNLGRLQNDGNKDGVEVLLNRMSIE